MEDVARINEWATGGLKPDLTILIDVPEAVAASGWTPTSTDSRRWATGSTAGSADGYRDLAAADPGGWVVIDGTGTVDEVFARVLAAVEERLS